jgi:hypothetical protein
MDGAVTDLDIIALAQIIAGLAIAALCIPLVQGRVPRNGAYGFRFSQSLASDENWYEINRYGGKRLLIWSLILALLGFAMLFDLLAPNSILLWAGFSIPLVLLLPVIQTYIYGRRFTDGSG